MSINIGDKPEMNVVNVGDEISQSQIEAIQNSNGATGTNVFLTKSAGDAAYAGLTTNNTLTGTQAYNVNSSGTAFRISQAGTGEAFRVEDSANPDSSPFVVTSTGWAGIGTASPTGPLTVSHEGGGNAVVFQASGSAVNTWVRNTSTATGIGFTVTQENTASTADAVRITNLGSGNSFVVEDSANPDSTPFVINSVGSVGIQTATLTGALNVGGNIVNTVFNSGNVITVGASNSGVPLTINNAGTGASFRVNDETSDTTPFIVDAGGNVGVKTASPAYDLDVNGTVNLGTLRFSDGTTLTTKPATYNQSLNTGDSVQFQTIASNTALFEFTGGNTYVDIQNGSTLDAGLTAGDTGYGSSSSITAYGITLSGLNQGITFPDNSVQTTAYTGGGGGILDDYEQTVTWTEFGVSSPNLGFFEFVKRLTDDGMMGYTNPTAFQNAGQPLAIVGCGKAIVNYVIQVEITSSGHSQSSPSGETRLFPTGSNNPYSDFDPTNPSAIANIYSGYMSQNIPTYGPFGTTSVTFNHTEIVSDDVGYVFPQLNCSEGMGSLADWRITVYLKVQKGV